MEGVQCCGQRNDRDETGKVRTTINLAANPPSLYTIVHSRRALNLLLFWHFSSQTLIPVCDGDRERPEPPS